MLPFISNLKNNLSCSRNSLKGSGGEGNRGGKSGGEAATSNDEDYYYANSAENFNISQKPSSNKSNLPDRRNTIVGTAQQRFSGLSNNSNKLRNSLVITSNYDKTQAYRAAVLAHQMSASDFRLNKSSNGAASGSLYNFNVKNNDTRSTTSINHLNKLKMDNVNDANNEKNKLAVMNNILIQSATASASQTSREESRTICRSDFYLNVNTSLTLNPYRVSQQQEIMVSSRLSNNSSYFSDYNLVKNSENFEFIIDHESDEERKRNALKRVSTGNTGREANFSSESSKPLTLPIKMRQTQSPSSTLTSNNSTLNLISSSRVDFINSKSVDVQISNLSLSSSLTRESYDNLKDENSKKSSNLDSSAKISKTKSVTSILKFFKKKILGMKRSKTTYKSISCYRK